MKKTVLIAAAFVATACQPVLANNNSVEASVMQDFVASSCMAVELLHLTGNSAGADRIDSEIPKGMKNSSYCMMGKSLAYKEFAQLEAKAYLQWGVPVTSEEGMD